MERSGMKESEQKFQSVWSEIYDDDCHAFKKYAVRFYLYNLRLFWNKYREKKNNLTKCIVYGNEILLVICFENVLEI